MQKEVPIIASCVGAALFGAVIASAAPKKGAAPVQVLVRLQEKRRYRVFADLERIA